MAFFVLAFESPVTESNRRPSPYHVHSPDALNCPLPGQGWFAYTGATAQCLRFSTCSGMRVARGFPRSIRRQVRPDAKPSNLITVNISGKHVLMAVEGIVYLLHYERPYHGPMRHYVGFTDDLEQRLQRHREGKGGKTTRRAFDQGIGFTLARTWSGSLSLERQIKSRGPSNYCPLCPRWSSGSSPSNLIGANALAEEDHSQGSAVRSTDAT